jgi:hypothetical protein
VPVASFGVCKVVLVDSQKAGSMEDREQWSPFLNYTLIRAWARESYKYLKKYIDVLVREKSGWYL